MSETASDLPHHIEQTVQAMAELHAHHHRQATTVQRAVDRLTGFVGRPRFVWIVSLAAVGWLALNVALSPTGHAPDPPPFAYFEIVGTFASVYITVLILITQTRQNRLSERRDQLTLELAMLSEQKSAKIIQLLEELRRDHPDIADREDAHAEALSVPADPHVVLGAIDDTQDGGRTATASDRPSS